jgi:predicted Zn-dependent protease
MQDLNIVQVGGVLSSSRFNDYSGQMKDSLSGIVEIRCVNHARLMSDVASLAKSLHESYGDNTFGVLPSELSSGDGIYLSIDKIYLMSTSMLRRNSGSESDLRRLLQLSLHGIGHMLGLSDHSTNGKRCVMVDGDPLIGERRYLSDIVDRRETYFCDGCIGTMHLIYRTLVPQFPQKFAADAAPHLGQ